MSTSIFEQVTLSFTVMSICGSLGPDIPAGTPLSELENLLDPGEDPSRDPWNDPSRVIDSEGDLVGILWFDNWALERELDPISVADDVMDRPEPWELLVSETTILEAAQILATRSTDLFYVIHSNQLVGYLCYRHLFTQLVVLPSLLLP